MVGRRQKYIPWWRVLWLRLTGRCAHCGSKDLWDDMTAYGCNCCGALFMTGDGPGPLIVENGTGRIIGRVP